MTPEQIRRAKDALFGVSFPAPSERANALYTALKGLRPEAFRSSGLTLPVIQDALERTLGVIDERRLLAFHAAHPGTPVSLFFTNLASNVFTAAVRPIVQALMLGVPVLVRPSARESSLAEHLEESLGRGALEGTLRVLRFGHDDRCFEAAMEGAEAIEFFGSDRTVSHLSALAEGIAPHAQIMRRGHGYGAAIVAGEASPGVIDALARDTAAYDQRGCLSPTCVYAPKAALEKIARRLHKAMTRIEERLPRGAIDAAPCSQWRSTCAALTEVFEGHSHAIAFDAEANLPPSPGFRHLLVRPSERFTSDDHLKVLALGPHVQAPSVPPAVRICAPGEMQSPSPFEGADGYAPAFGLVRS